MLGQSITGGIGELVGTAENVREAYNVGRTLGSATRAVHQAITRVSKRFSRNQNRLSHPSIGRPRWEALAMLSEEGCPICRRCAEQLERAYFWFTTESYGEWPAIHRIIESSGLCQEHFWDLVQRAGRRYQLSYVGQYLTEDLHAKLAEVAWAAVIDGNAKRNAHQLALAVKKLRRSRPCQFCEGLEESSEWALMELIDGLKYSDVQEAFRRSSGLCMPHFRQALERADVWRAKLLIEVQLTHTESVVRGVCQLATAVSGNTGNRSGAARDVAEFFAGRCP